MNYFIYNDTFSTVRSIFLLLIVFQLKHFLADYILQGKYMLGKFRDGWAWVPPLLAHCVVHGAITFVICDILGVGTWLALELMLVDICWHSVMDRIKASPRLLGRFKALSSKEYESTLHSLAVTKAESWKAIIRKRLSDNVFFWWSLGFDQMMHHLCHYYIIWRIIWA
jgi:hypothetical protein